MAIGRSTCLKAVFALCLFLCESSPNHAGSSRESRDTTSLSERSWGSNECLTPDRGPGTCIPVTECSHLREMLVRRPIPPNSARYLRQSLCGFIGRTPIVCCPASRPHSSQSSGHRPTNNQVWGDAGVHSNVNHNSHGNNRPHSQLHSQPNRPNFNSAQSQQPFHSNENPTANSGGQNSKMRLLPVSECGRDLNQRIFGGEQADIGEFPWMALLQYRNPRGGLGFYCGGVLISDRYVLTAAHCIAEDNVKLLNVRLGEHDTKSSPDCKHDFVTNEEICADNAVDIPVEREIPHPEYSKRDPNHYNDIALLRLQRKVKFSDYIQPICLPLGEVKTKSYVGKKLWVAGWGKTENRTESDIKLKLSLPVVDEEECRPVYEKASVRISRDLQMCAGGQKGRDSCNGDSGGPLMSADVDSTNDSKWFAAGVVAFGPVKCGQKNWPGVYTRVSSYIDFILANLEP